MLKLIFFDVVVLPLIWLPALCPLPFALCSLPNAQCLSAKLITKLIIGKGEQRRTHIFVMNKTKTDWKSTKNDFYSLLIKGSWLLALSSAPNALHKDSQSGAVKNLNVANILNLIFLMLQFCEKMEVLKTNLASLKKQI